MKKVYELTKQNLKNKYNIEIEEKKLQELYEEFIKRILEVKRDNLLREVFIPQFGKIKISKPKLERLVRKLFRNRDPSTIEHVNILRNLNKQYNAKKQYKNEN